LDPEPSSRSAGIGFAIFAAVMLAGPAMAADMPVKVKAPPPVPVYDWSGLYVGFNIGGTWFDVDRTFPQPLAPLAGPTTFRSSDSDVIYGFHAGAQAQWGNWVLGVELAYSACFHECRSLVVLPNPPFTGAGALPNTLSAYNKITNILTVGPRLGYAWDRWMIYATGGYASASLKGQYIITNNGLDFAPAFHGQTYNNGWFVGGGIEYMIHTGSLVDVILGAEYQHIDLDTRRAFTDTVVAGSPNTFDQTARIDLARARLTIKTHGWDIFYGPAPVVTK
jgi:outer membrane immunogenic protein